MDPVTRERYDRTWAFFPWEHPSAHWLRSDGEIIVCLRCSSRTAPPALGDDPAVAAQAFVDQHVLCPEGFGLRGSKPVPRRDPLFAA